MDPASADPAGPVTFIVTSALATRFGVFSEAQRFAQTLDTLASIRQRAPGARIVLAEMSGERMQAAHEAGLRERVDEFVDYSSQAIVQGIYRGNENWDLVKNATEMLCFRETLRRVRERGLGPSGRVFKLSGRYALSASFDPRAYAQPPLHGRVVLRRRLPSQFPMHVTSVPWQYMCRLWSFPAAQVPEIIAAYDAMRAFMLQRLQAGGYADIEHALYRFLDPAWVHEVDRIGVAGLLGPNGTAVEE